MSLETDFFSIDADVSAIVRWRATSTHRLDPPQLLVSGVASPTTADVMVRHLRSVIGVDRIDHLVSAHPDPLQTEGLLRMLTQVGVGTLWMHPPHDAPRRRFARRALSAAHRLLALAHDRGVPVREPVQGATIGPFYVLSPDVTWYRNELRPRFSAPQPTLWRRLLAPAWRAIRHHGVLMLAGASIEYLPRRETSSAEDESGTVLYGEIEGLGLLLAGRAGICAMEASCDYAEALGLQMPRNLRFAQLPFGGIDHLSSQVLDRLFGTRGSNPRDYRRAGALISMRNMVDLGKFALAHALAARSVTGMNAEGSHMHHRFETRDARPPTPNSPPRPGIDRRQRR